jgi:hypothetical protein
LYKPRTSSIEGLVLSLYWITIVLFTSVQSAQRYFHEEAARGQRFCLLIASTGGRNNRSATLPSALDVGPYRARCILGSDPFGCCHLTCELGGSSIVSQSPGRGGPWSFDLLWTCLKNGRDQACGSVQIRPARHSRSLPGRAQEGSRPAKPPSAARGALSLPSTP